MAQPSRESSDRAVSDASESAGSEPLSPETGCPLCGFTAEGDHEIYVHLQSSHPKSALATFVVGHRRE